MTAPPAPPSPRLERERLDHEAKLPPAARHRGDSGYVEPWRHHAWAASYDTHRNRRHR